MSNTSEEERNKLLNEFTISPGTPEAVCSFPLQLQPVCPWFSAASLPMPSSIQVAP